MQGVGYEGYIGMQDSLRTYRTHTLIGEKHQIMNSATNYSVIIAIIAMTRNYRLLEGGGAQHGGWCSGKGAVGISEYRDGLEERVAEEQSIPANGKAPWLQGL